ncbi:MAG: hypothetical protein Q9227_007663 [Pyrenula ochraceoflavens]
MTRVERITEALEKPALDDRSYRVVRLPNKLEALLVHDPETDKASASVNVNVGNFSDDTDMPGMAHAVEHLLFMGTKKYPLENEYSSYLSSNSGHSNAYTAATETNYFFECAASSESDASRKSATNGDQKLGLKANGAVRGPFYGALDRFSQFFVEPLFLSSTLDRELQAVDSENKKNLQSDNWRLTQLHKSLSNPDHPYHHFSTGNLKTLRDDPRKRGLEIRSEFIKFYQKHYSANRMKLVVLGKEPLDELEGWVEELFSDVKNQDLPQNRWDSIPLFSKDDVATQVFAKPVMDARSLDLQFPYQDEEEMYKEQPSHYLSHLIGHEGPGSILAYIKEKGWANSLSAGAYSVCPGSAFFTISVRLTPDGLSHYTDIVRTIFQYVALMKESPPKEWIFDEMMKIADVNFTFKEKSRASSFSRKTSSIMQKPIPREWLLSGQAKLRRFDAKAIRDAMEFLRPDNFRMTIVSQDYPGDWDKKEKWYGTDYKVEKISDPVMTELRGALETSSKDRILELQLPHENEFIPTRLDVQKKEVAHPAIAPKLVRNDSSARVWWKKDDQFFVPKANVNFLLKTPIVHATAANFVKSKLFCELVIDALSEYSYDAELAGLEYGLGPTSAGLDINVSGYNDKMTVLLEKVLTTIKSLVIRQDRFSVMKERLNRAYKNWNFQPAYGQVGEYTRFLSSDKSWMTDEYLCELQHIEAEDVRTFYPQIFSQAYLETLAHGNLHREDALSMTGLVESSLKFRKLEPSDLPMKRSVILPTGADYTFQHTLADPDNANNAIEYLLFVGSNVDRSLRAKVLLFSQMTDEPAFDQLRTKEQLGYIVWSGTRSTATQIGYRVIVQSDRSIDHLEARITAFLHKFGTDLEAMSADEFESHRRSLIARRLEKLKSLDQESARFFTHVSSEFYDFKRVDLDVAEIRLLTKDDMIEFYRRYIDPHSKRRARLVVQMLAKASPQDLKSLPAEERKDRLLEGLAAFFDSVGVNGNMERLTETFKSVEVKKGNEEGIVAATRKYLVGEGKQEADVKKFMEEGKTILDTFLAELGVRGPVDGEVLSNGVEKHETTLITDVNAWRATLQISEAARPVSDLSETEFATSQAKLMETIRLYPLSNYTFGTKENQPEEDPSVLARLKRLEEHYVQHGMRRTCEGILVCHEHNHPHVLMLQIANAFFKLPGDYLPADADEISGFKALLNSRLAPSSNSTQFSNSSSSSPSSPSDDWTIGDTLAQWWRPNFETFMYPFLPGHVTRPKECKKLYFIQLPKKKVLSVPKNMKLLAVPLFELYDNTARYGPQLSAIPHLLSRYRFEFVDEEDRVVAVTPGEGLGMGEGGEEGLPTTKVLAGDDAEVKDENGDF